MKYMYTLDRQVLVEQYGQMISRNFIRSMNVAETVLPS
jgi:hypothetical protein